MKQQDSHSRHQEARQSDCNLSIFQPVFRRDIDKMMPTKNVLETVLGITWDHMGSLYIPIFRARTKSPRCPTQRNHTNPGNESTPGSSGPSAPGGVAAPATAVHQPWPGEAEQVAKEDLQDDFPLQPGSRASQTGSRGKTPLSSARSLLESCV